MEKPAINLDFLAKRPVSYSSLKAFRKSPKHYIQYLTKPREITDAMLFGQIVECRVLEPEKFDRKFMVIKKTPQRSNAAKEEMERLQQEAAESGKIIIYESMVEEADLCVTALMDYESSRKLIEARRRIQLRMNWTHKHTGIPVTGIIDFESKAWESDFIVDLKTTKSADPDDFTKDAAKLDYHIQCGSYMDGYPRTQFRFPNMAFIAVENVDPFNVSVFFCENNYVSRALDEFHGTMNAFKYCMDHDQFGMGYDFQLMGIKDYFGMNIPPYVKQKFTFAGTETIKHD